MHEEKFEGTTEQLAEVSNRSESDITTSKQTTLLRWSEEAWKLSIALSLEEFKPPKSSGGSSGGTSFKI